MADRTAINPDAIRKDAGELADAFRGFQDSVRTLKSALAAEHGAWGDDKIGNQFAEKYVPAESKAHEGLDAVGSNGSDLAVETLPGIVDTLVGTDEENADLLAQDAKNLTEAAEEAEQA